MDSAFPEDVIFFDVLSFGSFVTGSLSFIVSNLLYFLVRVVSMLQAMLP